MATPTKVHTGRLVWLALVLLTATLPERADTELQRRIHTRRLVMGRRGVMIGSPTNTSVHVDAHAYWACVV